MNLCGIQVSRSEVEHPITRTTCVRATTSHHPDFRLDWQEEIVSVALATSAAPTFFSTYRNGTRHFADGGVWANNPIMAALVDALSCFEVDRHKIDILSLGCGDHDMKMTDGQVKRGGLFH